jgi:AAA ATPase domain/Protein of unknown function (DUF3696)
VGQGAARKGRASLSADGAIVPQSERMLRTVRLRNFKGWEDTGKLRLAPITVFFGTNSSGKTSLLQALLLMKQTAATSDRSRVLFPGDETSMVDLGTTADIVFAHDFGKRLRFELSWDLAQDVPTLEKGKTLAFEAEIAFTEEGKSIVETLSYSFDAVRVDMVRRDDEKGWDLNASGPKQLTRTRGRAWPLPAPVRFYGFPDEVASYFQDASWVADLALALEQELGRIHYVGPLREVPHRRYLWAGDEPPNVGARGERAIAALLAARAHKRTIRRGEGKGRRYDAFDLVVANWLRDMGVIDAFEFKQIARDRKDYEVRVRKTPGSPEVLITDVGFGVSQLLPVIVQAYYAQPGDTVILEQPEIHLHPRVQADLADLLIDAADRAGVQFVVESHSEHFLRRLQRRVAEEERIGNEQVALYFCRAEKQGSKIDALEVDQGGNIRNWPKDFFGDEMADRTAMIEAAIRKKNR